MLQGDSKTGTWSVVRDRLGFSLIEILIGLMIVVVLATVVTPNVVGLLDSARVDRAVASFEGFGDAVEEFEADVNRYPSSLIQLVEPISTGQVDACGRSFPKGQADKWSGPYLGRLVPADGIPVAIGSVGAPIDAVDDGGGESLRLSAPQVTYEDAAELDRRVDGSESPSSGTVRYTAPDTQGLVTLFYHLPIRTC